MRLDYCIRVPFWPFTDFALTIPVIPNILLIIAFYLAPLPQFDAPSEFGAIRNLACKAWATGKLCQPPMRLPYWGLCDQHFGCKKHRNKRPFKSSATAVALSVRKRGDRWF
jgi:hypothetical protein